MARQTQPEVTAQELAALEGEQLDIQERIRQTQKEIDRAVRSSWCAENLIEWGQHLAKLGKDLKACQKRLLWARSGFKA